MQSSLRQDLQRYGFALGCVAIGALLAQGFRDFFQQTPSLHFTFIIILSAWYGGLGPGLLATGLGFLAIDYLLFMPIYSFHIDHWFRVWRVLGLYTFTGVVSSLLIDALHRAQRDYQTKRRELWVLQTRYERIIETAREGIWILDAEGRTSYLSNRMAELLGYKLTEIPRLPLWDFLEPDSRALVLQLWERNWLGPQAQHTLCFRRRDGSSFRGVMATNTLYDDRARFTGVVCMVAEQNNLPCTESPPNGVRATPDNQFSSVH
jgi:PAS domain S-box-containing protein